MLNCKYVHMHVLMFNVCTYRIPTKVEVSGWLSNHASIRPGASLKAERGRLLEGLYLR